MMDLSQKVNPVVRPRNDPALHFAWMNSVVRSMQRDSKKATKPWKGETPFQTSSEPC